MTINNSLKSEINLDIPVTETRSRTNASTNTNYLLEQEKLKTILPSVPSASHGVPQKPLSGAPMMNHQFTFIDEKYQKSLSSFRSNFTTDAKPKATVMPNEKVVLEKSPYAKGCATIPSRLIRPPVNLSNIIPKSIRSTSNAKTEPMPTQNLVLPKLPGPKAKDAMIPSRLLMPTMNLANIIPKYTPSTTQVESNFEEVLQSGGIPAPLMSATETLSNNCDSKRKSSENNLEPSKFPRVDIDQASYQPSIEPFDAQQSMVSLFHSDNVNGDVSEFDIYQFFIDHS